MRLYFAIEEQAVLDRVVKEARGSSGFMTGRSSDQPVQAKSFLAAFRESPWDASEADLGRALSLESTSRMRLSSDRRMFAAYAPRMDSLAESEKPAPSVRIQLILGDNSEFLEAQRGIPMANGVLLECDFQQNFVHALASIVGLPTLFLYEGDGYRILSSSISNLTPLPTSGLRFDVEGVLDLCSYGFTIDHRTLFQGVRLVPGGVSLRMASDGAVEKKLAWNFPPREALADWNSYTELQMEAFVAALGRMELKQSFLSLTAGLDTRTILAALLSAGRQIDSYTLSGESPSLDALTARALCRAYGVPHQIVPLDQDFQRHLAEYCVEASRLSGGLASLGQAHQIHLYQKLPRKFAGRVSGNMGNQLGRAGVEHVSMRGADVSILNPELQKRASERPRFAWSNQQGESQRATSFEFLFQQEFPFTQLGNYSLGDSFAVQQSPYASRDLISLCSRQPLREDTTRTMSPLRLRLNDLHHRFLGEPETYSFQRRLIHRLGGFAASYPINWGWRAKGGVSLAGAARGFLTALDAYSERAGWDLGVPGRLLRTLHITGLHEHRKAKRWLQESLRDFVCDTLLSKEARDAGLFHRATLTRMVEEHSSGRASHHRALVLALDLALAAKNFRATL